MGHLLAEVGRVKGLGAYRATEKQVFSLSFRVEEKNFQEFLRKLGVVNARDPYWTPVK